MQLNNREIFYLWNDLCLRNIFCWHGTHATSDRTAVSGGERCVQNASQNDLIHLIREKNSGEIPRKLFGQKLCTLSCKTSVSTRSISSAKCSLLWPQLWYFGKVSNVAASELWVCTAVSVVSVGRISYGTGFLRMIGYLVGYKLSFFSGC